MGDPLEICFCTASRSERALIAPLLTKLENDPRFNLYIHELPINRPVEAMNRTLQLIQGHSLVKGGWSLDFTGRPIDIAFCPFDRPEMLAAAMVFFQNNIPIAQIHAGDRSLEGSLDDIVRHQITLCSTIQFCTGLLSYLRALHLLGSIDKSTEYCREIGFIQFDDLEIDYSIVPSEPFDLILYNSPTRRPDLITSELDEIENLLDKPTIWVRPNEDPGSELIITRIMGLEADGKVEMYETIPRSKFIGLLEKSERCIGNSSSFFLELPYFNKYHHHIGVRNKDREIPIEAKPGGTDRIIEFLGGWPYD